MPKVENLVNRALIDVHIFVTSVIFKDWTEES